MTTGVHVGNQKLTDLLERVGATFAFTFVSLLVTSLQHGVKVDWLAALDIAAFAAAITFGTTVVVVWLAGLHLLNAWADLLVRCVLTFIQVILASMAAAGAADFIHFDWNKALTAAITATGLLALKGFTGLARPDTAGASVAVRRPQRLLGTR